MEDKGKNKRRSMKDEAKRRNGEIKGEKDGNSSKGFMSL
jgi:hypothetical protein